MKLAVVCFTGDSGLTDYSVSLCKELTKKCDVTFITANSYDQTKYHVNFPSVKLFRRTRNYPIDIFRFARYILQNRPDIILFESWIKYPLIESIFLKLFKMVGIQVAFTIHDLLPHYPKPWSKLVLTSYYRCFDKLIVHSQRTLDGLASMGVETKPLLVPHGVYDIFNFNQLCRDDYLPLFPKIKQNDFVVLFFGHLETRKGILEFVAASSLLENEPGIKFIVAGESNQRLVTEQLNIHRNKPNIIIADSRIPIDEIQAYFTIAHVIVLPYLEGTTSGVVKLAMAFEKPIIATDVGDFPETLNDWSGLLIQLDDIPQNIAASVRNVRDNYDSFMLNLGKNKTKYQWGQIARQHLDYFGSLK